MYVKTYQLAEADYKKGLKYKEIAEKYDVSLSTVKSWKLRYKWTRDGEAQDIKTESTQERMQKKVSAYTSGQGEIKESAPRKVKKEMARVMIEEGATITEVSEQLGIPRSTIGRWSSEEKMQVNQLECLKDFRDMFRERIRTNKLKRLALNEEALQGVEEDIRTSNISKLTFEKIKLSEEIEQLIMELDRIEKLERLEIEKAKLDKEDDKDNKVIEVLDRIGSALND